MARLRPGETLNRSRTKHARPRLVQRARMSDPTGAVVYSHWSVGPLWARGEIRLVLWCGVGALELKDAVLWNS